MENRCSPGVKKCRWMDGLVVILVPCSCAINLTLAKIISSNVPLCLCVIFAALNYIKVLRGTSKSTYDVSMISMVILPICSPSSDPCYICVPSGRTGRRGQVGRPCLLKKDFAESHSTPLEG